MYLINTSVSPRDKDEYGIWRKFVDKVIVDLAVVVRMDAEDTVSKSKLNSTQGAPTRTKWRDIKWKLSGLGIWLESKVFLLWSEINLPVIGLPKGWNLENSRKILIDSLFYIPFLNIYICENMSFNWWRIIRVFQFCTDRSQPRHRLR